MIKKQIEDIYLFVLKLHNIVQLKENNIILKVTKDSVWNYTALPKAPWWKHFLDEEVIKKKISK